MFWFFKIFPEWLWPAIVVLGVLGFASSYLPLAHTLTKPVRIISLVLVFVSTFLCGMLYADNTWKHEAAQLQLKVSEAEAKSAAVNEVVRDRVITKLQVVKVRGEDVTKYIKAEVTKTDGECKIPAEFVVAHDRAAETPK